MELRSKIRKTKEVEESSPKKFKFTDLITDLITELNFKVFDYLSFEHLSLARQARKGWKNIIDNYVKLRQRHLLRLPPDIEYSEENIENLPLNIYAALQFLGKQPNQCLLPVDCKIFYSKEFADVTTSPPLDALIAINDSGVKISLNIMFDFQDDPDEPTIMQSYMFKLDEIFKNISNMECLKIGPAPHQHLSLEPALSKQILNKIEYVAQQGSQLRDLSICKMDVYSDDILSCLREITQLSSFSMSDGVIYHTDIVHTDVSGLGTDFLDVLQLKNLTNLKLSHSAISIMDADGYTNIHPIVRLLPHLTPEILLKLKTLDLSNNKGDGSFCTVPTILYKSLENLEELNLAGNDINQECFEILLPFIESLKNLKKLNLSYNKIRDFKTIEEHLPEVSILILHNDELEQMALEPVYPPYFEEFDPEQFDLEFDTEHFYLEDDSEDDSEDDPDEYPSDNFPY